MSPRTGVAPTPITIDHALEEAGTRTLAEDALDGLTQPCKEIPPKHFYDSYGAALFDQICELPEYYPTRTERSILERASGEIIGPEGAGELVELGSGSASKTRVLLDAMARAGTLERYIGIDVTESVVRETALQLLGEYPGITVHGLIGDFERHLERLPPPQARRLFVFLGGTIGVASCAASAC
jgi:L-histidine N-alpha-methyltransferase